MRALPAARNLRGLNLCGNRLTDAGVIALVDALPKTRVEWVNLSRNRGVTDVAVHQLLKILPATQVTRVVLDPPDMSVESHDLHIAVFNACKANKIKRYSTQ